MIVQLMRPSLTPLTVFEPLIQSTIPWMMVAEPRVTMNESISSNVTSAPLIRPMNSPMARTTTIAGNNDQPWRTCRIASTIDASDSTAAIERSKSPLVSGTIRPSARISSTAWEPKIVWKLPDVA